MRARCQAHLQTPRFVQMNQTTTPWVEKKTVWRYVRLAP